MTVYFDHMNYTAKISPDFDPAVEWYSFMYYKLLDWTTKIGFSKAQVLTGVPEWQAATEGWDNNSTVHLQLILNSDDVRDGSFTSNYYTCFDWYHQSTSYFYAYAQRVQKDRARNSTYGHIDADNNYQLYRPYRPLYGTNVTRGYKLAVMYCDTPDREWFAISDSQFTNGGTYGFNMVIAKVQPRPGLQPGHGTGWALFSGTSAMPFGTQIQADTTHPLSGVEENWTNYGDGAWGGNMSSAHPYLFTSPPLMSLAGFWLATAPNFGYSNTPGEELSIIQTADNKQWLHWKNGLHIDVTGEGGLA